MSRRDRPQETPGQWLAGVIVMVATAVSFVGFARVSLGWTLVISTAVLIGLILFLWSAGLKKQRADSSGRERT